MEAAEVVRRYLEAMQRADTDAAFAYYADDLVARIPGRSRFAGEIRGRAAVVSALREMLTGVEDLEVELVELLSGQERVALLLRERLRGGGRTLAMSRVNVYRVRDGRIVEIAIFEADQYEVDEFLAPPA